MDERFACKGAGLTLSSTGGVSSVASGMLLKAPGATIYSKGPSRRGIRTEMRPRSTLQQDFKKAAEVICQYVHINMRVTHTPCNLLAMTHYSGDLKYAMTSRSDLDAVIEVHKVEAIESDVSVQTQRSMTLPMLLQSTSHPRRKTVERRPRG